MNFDTAKGRRNCSNCKAKILPKQRHMAEVIFTKYGAKRRNYCKECSLKEINIQIIRLIALEERVKTEL